MRKGRESLECWVGTASLNLADLGLTYAGNAGKLGLCQLELTATHHQLMGELVALIEQGELGNRMGPLSTGFGLNLIKELAELVAHHRVSQSISRDNYGIEPIIRQDPMSLANRNRLAFAPHAPPAHQKVGQSLAGYLNLFALVAFAGVLTFIVAVEEYYLLIAERVEKHSK